MSEFKPITTQEDLDSIIVKRLERESKKVTKELTEKYQKELEEAKGLKSANAELQQKLEKVTKEAGLYAEAQKSIAELNAKVKAYETQHIKTEVALKNGLDLKAVAFLKGETAEEIEASAEALKGLVSTPKLPEREPYRQSSTEKVREATKSLSQNLFKE